MQPTWSYHWHRFSSRLHRLRVMVHSKGLAAALRKLIDGPRTVVGPAATSGPCLPVSRSTSGQVRLLFVDATTPRPDRDSGSLRAFNLMKQLAHQGYGIDFLPDDGADADRYTAELGAVGVHVHCGPQVGSHPRWFAENHGDYAAVIISRHHLASYWIPMVQRIAPRMKIVFDTVDLHHLREQREAELHGNSGLLRSAKATLRRELASIMLADTTWVVSPVEKAILLGHAPRAQIEVVPNLHEVQGEIGAYHDRQGMLFVGGGNHPPNVDAVRWLVEDIYPLIRERLPDCALHIVGDGLEAKLASACGQRDGIVFHGHVPDLTPLLSKSRVGLAPLRFGAGVKGKINQYMAHGLPTVATGCAIEGMYLTDRIDVMTADGPATFANAVISVHEDPLSWAGLSSNGLANVRKYFSLDAVNGSLDATFGDLKPPAKRGD